MENVAVKFKEALRFWAKLGFINFGGPAGQIAIMHKELVDRKRWISESQFLRALNFCMILPGPEAQQLATYIGWRLHGTLGGIVAGSFFVIPSIFVLLLLSWLAAAHADVPAIAGLLYGVQPVVIAIVIEALLRIGKRTLHHALLVAFAVVAFVAIHFLHISFPLIIAAAALSGVLLERWWPGVFQPLRHAPSRSNSTEAPANENFPAAYPSMSRNLKLVAIFPVLWLIPIGAIWLWRGGSDVLQRSSLLHKSSVCDLWWSLCGSQLHRRCFSQSLQLAGSEPNGTRTRFGRVNTRSTNHGHSVCRFFGGVEFSQRL